MDIQLIFKTVYFYPNTVAFENKADVKLPHTLRDPFYFLDLGFAKFGEVREAIGRNCLTSPLYLGWRIPFLQGYSDRASNEYVQRLCPA